MLRCDFPVHNFCHIECVATRKKDVCSCGNNGSYAPELCPVLLSNVEGTSCMQYIIYMHISSRTGGLHLKLFERQLEKSIEVVYMLL